MGKKSIEIKTFWYSDVLVMPMPIYILTTISELGLINAAPFSLGTPCGISKKQPQMMVVMRRNSHTVKNVAATKEFVVNFPSWDHLDSIMETAKFWPFGENELDHTNYTTTPSKKVAPPSIQECKQHIECTLNEIVDMGHGQYNIIGDIVNIVVNEELIDMEREERIRATNLAIYMGDTGKRYFDFGRVETTEQRELLHPEITINAKIVFNMPWEDDALKALKAIPAFVHEVVVELIEEEAQKAGLATISAEFFKKMSDEYAPDEALSLYD